MIQEKEEEFVSRIRAVRKSRLEKTSRPSLGNRDTVAHYFSFLPFFFFFFCLAGIVNFLGWRVCIWATEVTENRFSVGQLTGSIFSLQSVPKDKRKPNSHLSLLAMVDCWYQLKMNPYSHMVCQTPLFRFWL